MRPWQNCLEKLPDAPKERWIDALFSKKIIFGGHGIVGAQIPMGAGIAFAEQYKGSGNVCLCYFGDGAVRQGSVHETFNMAMLWKLPVVFICENNGYAMGTSLERSTNQLDMYKIGAAYDMPSYPVDGMQPETVHASIYEAVERARNGEGPTFLEIRTYRYRGHSMSDPAKYRKRKRWKNIKCAILWKLLCRKYWIKICKSKRD